MSIKLETNAEPIPGYRLIERLGGGGFGEVWKAEAPGGFSKAIKFVYGLLDSSNDEDDARAEQELRSLTRLRDVRHVYILTLEAIHKVESQLLLVMELADRTLWDRFRECRTQGLLGIPRKELIGLLKEAAEALDYMYSQFQLLHLDIKPQNLFLVNTHIKVADFGLTKNLDNSAASITGGVTPVYAAPETFDGEGRRTTDQYSLAIVYQEMLTGQRPFAGTTARQLVLQHLQAEPDLAALPLVDQVIVRKALSKDYRDRFSTCMAFVEALEAAAPEKSPPPPNSAAVDLPVSIPSAPSNGPARQTGEDGSRNSSLPTIHRKAGADPNFTAARPASQLLDRLALSEPAPIYVDTREINSERPGLLPETTGRLSASDRQAALMNAHSATPGSQSTLGSPLRALPSLPGGQEVLVPALVIGIGALGQAALKQLRRQIHDRFGDANNLTHIRTLCLDCDPEALAAAGRGGASALDPHETLLTRLHRASHYLKPKEGNPGLQSWLPARMLYRIPRQLVPTGVRALGRLAFVDNYEAIRRRVEAELQACVTDEALTTAREATGLGVAAGPPRVIVVAGLAGGTGSGMFIDVGYLAQTLLREAGVAQPDVAGVLLLPPTDRPVGAAPGLANTFAALTELQHFGQPGTTFSASYAGKEGHSNNGNGKVSTREAPFRRCLLIAAGEKRSSSMPELEAAGLQSTSGIGSAANLLFTELCTPLGREVDRERRKWLERQPRDAEGGRGGMVYQTADLVRIHWPYPQILKRAAIQLCQRLVQHWNNKDARPLRESIGQWVQKQWADLDLSANQRIERLQQFCHKAMGKDPADLLSRTVHPLAATLAAACQKNSKAGREGGGPSLSLGQVVEVLEELEKVLGVPDGCQGTTNKPLCAVTPGSIAEILKDAVADQVHESEGRIAELVVRLIEQPEFRLAGAEDMLRQFADIVQRALENQEEITRELQERTAILYCKIHTLLEHSGKRTGKESSWFSSVLRRSSSRTGPNAQELLEAVQNYPKCRLQSLILQSVNSFYVSLRGQLSDQLREVDYCRGRLGDLSTRFLEEKTRAEEAGGAGAEQQLLPQGCESVADAVEQVLQRVAPDDFLLLDHQVEQMIRQQFRALVHVCMASSSLLRNFVPQLLWEAQSFVQSRLPTADAVQLYLNKFGQECEGGMVLDEAALAGSLLAAYEKAQPILLGATDEDSLCLLATPDSAESEHLREMARQALPRTRVQFATSVDEIVLYREQLHSSLADLGQITQQTRPAYEQLANHEILTPHSRLDICEWAPINS